MFLTYFNSLKSVLSEIISSSEIMYEVLDESLRRAEMNHNITYGVWFIIFYYKTHCLTSLKSFLKDLMYSFPPQLYYLSV